MVQAQRRACVLVASATVAVWYQQGTNFLSKTSPISRFMSTLHDVPLARSNSPKLQNCSHFFHLKKLFKFKNIFPLINVYTNSGFLTESVSLGLVV